MNRFCYLSRVCIVFGVYAIVVVSAAKRLRIGNAGPYRLVVRKFLNSTPGWPPSTYELASDIHFMHRKPGQMQYFWGNIDNKIDFNDELKLRVSVSKWENNQWKLDHIRVDLNRACNDAKFQADQILEILIGSGPCPIKAGRKILKNETRDFRFSRVPTYFYGRWRLVIAVMRGNTVVGFKALEVDSVPRM